MEDLPADTIEKLARVTKLPLEANGRTVGALNLYSRRPDAFDARAEEAVQL